MCLSLSNPFLHVMVSDDYANPIQIYCRHRDTCTLVFISFPLLFGTCSWLLVSLRDSYNSILQTRINLSFTYKMTHLNSVHNLGGRLGTIDNTATIPFHLSLSSAAIRESPNSNRVLSLMLSFHLFFCLPLLLAPLQNCLRYARESAFCLSLTYCSIYLG